MPELKSTIFDVFHSHKNPSHCGIEIDKREIAIQNPGAQVFLINSEFREFNGIADGKHSCGLAPVIAGVSR
jgi:hypothetical protein